MQQNEAEMFQQTVNNNFNPSSGGLTYKYQNSFLKMWRLNDATSDHDFCSLGTWEGHWLQKRGDSWNCQAIMSTGSLEMSTQTKTLSTQPKILAMSTGSAGRLTQTQAATTATPILASFPHLTRWVFFCSLSKVPARCPTNAGFLFCMSFLWSGLARAHIIFTFTNKTATIGLQPKDSFYK